MTAAALKAAATGVATPEEAKNPYEALKRSLETSKAEFKPLLGSDTNVERFIRVVLNAVLGNPELLGANRRSLIASCMKAAQDGLLPDGREAVLNIYSTKQKQGGKDVWIDAVQYLPMVAGLIKKLYESGEVTYVDAAAVYANDKFVFRRGDNPVLEHEPTLADDPGIVVAAYVVIKLKSGEIKREVMPRRDIEAVRAVSRSGEHEKGPWKKWYDQQAIKSVIKRVYKQLPKADALERIIASDNEALGFVSATSAHDIAKPALAHQPPDHIEMPAQADKESVPVAEPKDDFVAGMEAEEKRQQEAS